MAFSKCLCVFFPHFYGQVGSLGSHLAQPRGQTLDSPFTSGFCLPEVIVKALVEKGAAIDFKDYQDRTPLHEVLSVGPLASVRPRITGI